MDARKNFAYSTVATAPSPATSGVTLILAALTGTRFPDPSVSGAYNIVVWPAGTLPLPSNAEVLRVTAKLVDTLTVTRTQESSSARTIIAGDQVVLTPTDKVWDDIDPAISESTYNVKVYGATGDGTTDDTAAISRAAADWVAAQAGTLFFPAGHYKVTASNVMTMNYPGMSIRGDGQGSTFIEPTSAVTGDVIRWQMNPTTQAPAGRIANLTIDGTNASAGACGLHVGDVMNHRLDNFVVQNFGGTGCIGIHFDNTAVWTEECVWTNVYVSLNKTGVLFDVNGGTTSWGYNRIQLRVNQWGGQTGIAFKGGGVYYGGSLQLTGNLNDAGCIGIDVQDTCVVTTNWSAVLESTNSLPLGMKLAAGTYLKGVGFIDLANGITTSTNAGSFNITFGGWFNVPGIQSGEGFSSQGAAPIFRNGINISPNSAGISGGNGAPSGVSVTGTYYLRQDTPTVANQRIYVCTNGPAGTWVGFA